MKRMKNVLRKITHRRLSDRADSAVITFILILPMFFSFIITMVDTSIYFSNRSVVQQIGRDAVRTVSIFGGAGNATQQTAIENSYGSNNCENPNGTGIALDASLKALTDNKTSIECGLVNKLAKSSGMTNISFTSVKCGPTVTESVGAETYCDIKWKYGGVPGSALSFIKKTQDNETRITGSSEVKLDSTSLVLRPIL